MKPLLPVACALSLAFAACKKKPQALAQIDPPQAPPKSVTQGPKITEAEAETVARALEQAVQRNNAAAFDRIFDLKAMVDHGMPADLRGTAQAKEVTHGILSTLSGNLLQNLNAGDYRFLSATPDPDGASAHMRLLPGDGSLNYHRLIIGRNAAQQPTVVDVFVYVTGEPLSHTMGRMVGQLSGGSGHESMAVAQGMQRASTALQAGQPARALAVLDGLPARWQQQKSIMQMRIVAANGVAAQNLEAGRPLSDGYQKAVRAFQAAFPKADHLALLLMDYHFLARDFPKAAAAVDQLDQQVGRDPYLNLIRTNIAVGQGDAKAVRQFAEAFIAALPDRAMDAYGAMLDFAIHTENHAETTRVLKAIEANTSTRFPVDFNKAEPFARYRASTEYERWKQYKAGLQQPE